MVSLLRFPDIKPAVSIHDDVFVKIRNGPDFIVPDIEVKLLTTFSLVVSRTLPFLRT